MSLRLPKPSFLLPPCFLGVIILGWSCSALAGPPPGDGKVVLSSPDAVLIIVPAPSSSVESVLAPSRPVVPPPLPLPEPPRVLAVPVEPPPLPFGESRLVKLRYTATNRAGEILAEWGTRIVYPPDSAYAPRECGHGCGLEVATRHRLMLRGTGLAGVSPAELDVLFRQGQVEISRRPLPSTEDALTLQKISPPDGAAKVTVGIDAICGSVLLRQSRWRWEWPSYPVMAKWRGLYRQEWTEISPCSPVASMGLDEPR